MRILIVTHASISPELGAGQMAINLGEALRKQGHKVQLWSPHPFTAKARWGIIQQFLSLQQMRSKLDTFIETQEPFDIIDSPAVLITKKISKSALVVSARSVQPNLLYQAEKLRSGVELSLKGIVRLPINYAYSLTLALLVFQGWSRATYILCLGSVELNWMKRWFPWWREKLLSYVNALSKPDREALAEVRQHRKMQDRKGIQFLWIGRWASHKGVDKLIKFIIERVGSYTEDTFTIAGCGDYPEKDVPKELIQSGRVKLIPSFTRNQLYSILANHDVGLFTSRVEGWGLSLNEMLESGMTVFATPAGGVLDLQPFFKEVLKPFPPPKSFTNEQLVYSPFPENYYEVFNWDKIAEKYKYLVTNCEK